MLRPAPVSDLIRSSMTQVLRASHVSRKVTMHEKMTQTFRFKLKRVCTPKDALFGIFPDLPWYGRWLHEQLRLQPSSMFDCLPDFDCEYDGSLTDISMPLCSKVSNIIKNNDAPSIDSIVELLLKEASIRAGEEH
ncbi:hypothetical protein F5B21DRAFT_55128 [Xylaria acuta]|nr:hypothetical protein F5B21DRAFT_55128 [Xylaria acuta]